MSETGLPKMCRLDGRRAVITGGAGHIARAITAIFLKVGAELILVDRDADALAQAVKDAPAGRVRAVVADLEKPEAAAALIQDALGAGGSLDILVNNAAFVGTSGLTGWAVKFEDQSVDTWRRALEVNLTAPFVLIQALAPSLAASGHGSIINVGSIYGVVGPDMSLYEGFDMGNPAAYAASKGGLLQLTRYLAAVLAPRVRVNMMSPGGISRGQPEAFVTRYEARTPLGRMAREKDLQGVALFLASDMSAYMTGENLMVDGGWTVR